MFDLNVTLDVWSNGGVESSSSNDDACSGLVTQDLFPLSRLNESTALHLPVQQEVQQVQARKSRRGPRSRSSQYRGVTFYRRTGRWESHIWECGKQVYLGGFDTAVAAARAYDRAAIKFRGVEADINFNHTDYDMKQMMNLSKQEFLQALRKQSNGFSTKYRPHKAYDKGDGETTMEPPCYNDNSLHDLSLNLGMSASSACLDSSKLHPASHGGLPLPSQSQRPSLNPESAPHQERKTSGSINILGNSSAASSRFSSAPNISPSPSYSWINPLPPS